jgi:ABC-type enterobactin transport system permease subunit
MKNIQILVLFIIGGVLTVTGALFKIKEWPLASLLLIVGMTFEAVAFILVLIKLFKKNSTDSFLDS